MGLSSRRSRTSASAVISSPGFTGDLKLQSTCRKTLPGPGRSSATRALGLGIAWWVDDLNGGTAAGGPQSRDAVGGLAFSNHAGRPALLTDPLRHSVHRSQSMGIAGRRLRRPTARVDTG